jgi:hypothetical protein
MLDSGSRRVPKSELHRFLVWKVPRICVGSYFVRVYDPQRTIHCFDRFCRMPRYFSVVWIEA